MLLYLISLAQAHTAFLRREEGQDLAEYALLIGLIAIAVIAAVTLLGQQISQALSSIADAIF
jgi:pilus assembly protein Flp/PilA